MSTSRFEFFQGNCEVCGAPIYGLANEVRDNCGDDECKEEEDEAQ